LRVYLDACCLNRFTDDQSQARIRDESEAVEATLRLVRARSVTWVSSAVLEIAINRNPDADRRNDVARLLSLANEVVVPQSPAVERAASLQKLGSTRLMPCI
jgi:hypothetical protein